jgi:T5orf172 domain
MKLQKAYVLTSNEKPWRFKVGIAKSVAKRQKQINMHTEKKFAIFCANAHEVEQSVHRVLAPLHTDTTTESGHTEWFWCVNVISAGVVGLALWPYVGFMYAGAGAFALLLLPYPLDGIGLVVAACLLQLLYKVLFIVSLIAAFVGIVYTLCKL